MESARKVRVKQRMGPECVYKEGVSKLSTHKRVKLLRNEHVRWESRWKWQHAGLGFTENIDPITTNNECYI